MQHPFEALRGEYETLLAHAKIDPRRATEVDQVCRRLLRDKQSYLAIELKTGVPTAVLMALNEREDSGNLHCYLGNGQQLIHRTTLVPAGRGPFLAAPPQNFIDGALDALHLDGLDKVAGMPGGWYEPRAAYETEWWNGFGYRAYGIPSPYPFGATSVQRPGKFIADHKFSRTLMDPQLGCVAIWRTLAKLDASLALPGQPIAPAPADTNADHIVIAASPEGLGGSIDGVKVLQTDLNKLGCGPIDIDGSYGAQTRRAVIAFQKKVHLADINGLADPQTLAAITTAMAA